MLCLNSFILFILLTVAQLLLKSGSIIMSDGHKLEVHPHNKPTENRRKSASTGSVMKSPRRKKSRDSEVK